MWIKSLLICLYDLLHFSILFCNCIQSQAKMKYYPTDDILYKLIRSGTKGAIGLPLNVQVIGKPWHEEAVLRIMKELEELASYSS